MRLTILMSVAFGIAATAGAHEAISQTAQVPSRATQPAAGAAAGSAQARLQFAERVARHVHVLRQAEPTFAGVIGNVAVIEQSDGLVLIDSGVSHGSGLRVVALVRSISPKPVKAVVITHWHNDHPRGLSAIVAAWPKAEIIAHEKTLEDMKDGRLGEIPLAPSSEYEARRVDAVNRSFTQIEALAAERAGTPEERRDGAMRSPPASSGSRIWPAPIW